MALAFRFYFTPLLESPRGGDSQSFFHFELALSVPRPKTRILINQLLCNPGYWLPQSRKCGRILYMAARLMFRISGLEHHVQLLIHIIPVQEASLSGPQVSKGKIPISLNVWNSGCPCSSDDFHVESPLPPEVELLLLYYPHTTSHLCSCQFPFM